MSIKLRRFVFAILVILFVTLSPILIMTAKGYKFDFKNKSWYKTGVLFLESKPTKAEVFINAVLQEEETTACIKGLLPASYHIEVNKEGYKGWSKKMDVKENLTTFAQYIQLFASNLDRKIVFDQEIDLVSDAVDNIVFVAYESISRPTSTEWAINRLDMNNGDMSNLITHPEPILQMITSPTNKSLVLQDANNDWYFINNNLLTTESLAKFKIKTDAKIIFDNRDKDIFYYLDQVGIHEVNLDFDTTKLLVAGDVIDFDIQKNKIVFVENINNTSQLTEIEIKQPNKPTKLSNLPFSNQYHFYKSPDSVVSLVDELNDIFYLFDFDLKIFDEKKLIFPDVKEIVWHDNARSFLFTNNNEVWVYRQQEGEYSKKLVTRLSTPIEKSLWFNIDTHVIYFSNDKMYIKEAISDNPFSVSYEDFFDVRQAYLAKDKMFVVSGDGIEKFLLQ